MATVEFKLPDLGEGIHEAEILQVKVKVGDVVIEDQPIFEVETDKAVVEIPSPCAGTIEQIHVKVGEIGRVGKVMITFNTTAGATTAAKENTHAAGSSASAKSAEAEKELAVASAAHTSAAGASPAARTANNGSKVETGLPTPATPATRRLAREMNIDIDTVPGSGAGGRVLKEDVTAFAAGTLERHITKSPTSSTSTASAPVKEQSLAERYGSSSGKDEQGGGSLSDFMTAQPTELPDFSKFGPIERIPLRSLRRKIAQNMTQAWTHIPHVGNSDEADITHLESARAKAEKDIAAKGGKLTLTVIVLKALAQVLKKYPQFNSSLDERSGEIIFKRYYNIGVAVATDRGLIVPVIRDVDKKSILDLSIELADIAAKTRAGKIELERLQGGTFTVTNVGPIGGTGVRPMVNFPECAILGMARAKETPVVRQGRIEVGLILPLDFSFDHRIADGAEAAHFLREVAEHLENPFKFLIES